MLPSRGEGWGRPHVEAMSLGLPVIATNWSGPTAFMTRENAYPLAVQDELVALPEDSHWKTHRWAQPSEHHLRSLLKHVHASPEEARRKGERAAADVRRRFAPETVARGRRGTWRGWPANGGKSALARSANCDEAMRDNFFTCVSHECHVAPTN